MRFQYNDGGREAAGYQGHTGDCVVRAIAIASGLPYTTVYTTINQLAGDERVRAGKKRSSARTGVWKKTFDKYLHSLGFQWVPTMQIGSGCHVHLRSDELPLGTVIVRMSKHIAAVIDGVLHDTSDGSRNETRCVYGYYVKS